MDKYINSPLKKTKQTSLSQFYRKPQHQDQHLSNVQSPSSISLTPSKLKSQQHDSSKFAGKISSPLRDSRTYHPLINTQQYKPLDINSNLKLKMEDMFQEQQIIIKPSRDNIYIQPPVFTQNLFSKMSQNSYYLNQQKSNLQGQSTIKQQLPSSQIMTRKFDNSYSDLDLNLSVEPQEIRIPQVRRYSNVVNQFRLHDDDKLDSNFLITPQNSLIKSPQKYLPIETNHFTPLQSNKLQDRQPPSSQIIQRLRFNTQILQITGKKEESVHNLLEQQQQIKKIPSDPFDKHLQSSSSPRKYTNKIPSPTKSNKRSPSIQQSPQKSSKNIPHNKQILSSDDQDSSQLLSKIRQLQSQVTQLKTHKYQFAINKYRQQAKYQLQKQLQSSLKQINSRYDQRQQTLKKQAQIQVQLYNKSIQDIAKYKKTYAIILNQLKENKDKIEDEYKEKVEQVKKYKERLVHDWKRQSNQEIKKIVNNTHVKHSIRLSASKQKTTNSSRQKINGPFSKDKPSSMNSTK